MKNDSQINQLKDDNFGLIGIIFYLSLCTDCYYKNRSIVSL